MGGSYNGPLSRGSAGLGSIEGRYNDSGWPARRYSKPFCLRHEYGSRYEGSIGPVIAPAALRTRVCAAGCAILAMSGGVSATAGCSSCCGGRESHLGSTGSTGVIARKGSPPASGGLAAKLRGPVPRSWSRRGPTRAGRWTSSTTRFANGRRFRILNHRRRRHQGMPGGRSGDLDLGAARCARTDGNRKPKGSSPTRLAPWYRHLFWNMIHGEPA